MATSLCSCIAERPIDTGMPNTDACPPEPPPADASATDGAPSRCLVAMYHYVHDRDLLNGLGLQCSGESLNGLAPAAFRAQLEQLCREMEPVDWPTLYAATQGRASLPSQCFLPTFDDGLADHVNVVMPILNDLALRGAFFIPGSVLASQHLLTAHAIHLLMLRLGADRFQREIQSALANDNAGARILRDIESDPHKINRAAQEMYDYESADRAHLKYLLTMVLPVELRRNVIAALFEKHVGSQKRWAGHWYVGWDDLVTLQSFGHTIGGHGFTHEPFARLAAKEVRADAHRVATILNEGLGSDIRPFSYPYGSVQPGAATAVRDAGFAQAFTTECRWLDANDDPLHLPRVDTIRVDVMLKEPAACLQT